MKIAIMIKMTYFAKGEKMEKEFNLSKKKLDFDEFEDCYHEVDVKEFIKIIEIEATAPNLTIGKRMEIIRKRAGDKLI